jgi:hypothetical protein
MLSDKTMYTPVTLSLLLFNVNSFYTTSPQCHGSTYTYTWSHTSTTFNGGCVNVESPFVSSSTAISFARAGQLFIQPGPVTHFGDPIEWIDTARYLGVTLDTRLTW